MTLSSTAVTLFFVMDPFGNTPVAIALLGGVPKARRPWVVLREGLFALGLLVFFYLAGSRATAWLGLSTVDLQMGGGVVLFLIALRMIFPDGKAWHCAEAQEKEPFLVPLAIPLIAGPSALATVMLMSGLSGESQWAGLGMVGLAWGASTLLLLTGVAVGSRLHPRLAGAIERLMGLLLIVVAIHMVMTGAQAYFRAP